jgi:hypothetical protein
MTPEIERGVFERLPITRRKFVRRVVAGTAFAAPLVASFDMSTLTAFASDTVSPNQYPSGDGEFLVRVLNPGVLQKHPTDRPTILIEILDPFTQVNLSSASLPVVLVSITPQPTPTTPTTATFTFKKGKTPSYALQLSTAGWPNGNYTFGFTVGVDLDVLQVQMLHSD